ncbi:hypothetical protein K3495_g3084 [Podosphaera aphanis]|nr:hypothetical protein K3495_g3084 [Podosphaera aphanis]
MNCDQASMEPETSLMNLWSTPIPQHVSRTTGMVPHESDFFFTLPEEHSSLPTWDSSTMPLHPLHESFPSESHPTQRDYIPASTNQLSWYAKSCENQFEVQNYDTDMNLRLIGQAYTTDENDPIIELKDSGSSIEEDNFTLGHSYNPRRMSGSSFTMSTTGFLSDLQPYEEFSSTLSDATTFSDHTSQSNRNSMLSSTSLSPVASSHLTPQNRTGMAQARSHGRASPSPRLSMRSTPYNMESSHNKRWSTGSYALALNKRSTPFVYRRSNEGFNTFPPRVSSRHSSPIMPKGQQSLVMSDTQIQQPSFQTLATKAGYPANKMLIPSQSYPEPPQYENMVPLLSHNIFRMLQSNADARTLHGHFADLSEPPDLYASLHEEQLPPSPEDMNPSDPDLVPHEQELRFEGDLYTPRWVRGHGNKREGWCGICKPGRWLILKNSAFWYDKSFTHGISAATGSPFQEPKETRRMDGNPEVWEGLCGSCNERVALVSSKKKGTTWFRHAYKCHTHSKVKDAPKRRRESLHTRTFSNSTTTIKKERPSTPQRADCSSSTDTPAPIKNELASTPNR